MLPGCVNVQVTMLVSLFMTGECCCVARVGVVGGGERERGVGGVVMGSI